MSLGDQLRYLRAMRGGPSLRDVAAAIGETSASVHGAIERRYCDPSSDALVEKLAAYYGVPIEELHWHRVRLRRNLALHVLAAMKEDRSVTLRLRNGETLRGRPAWWDLSAIGLEPDDGGTLIVVQRHAVIDWA